jgi:hypothetical protein
MQKRGFLCLVAAAVVAVALAVVAVATGEQGPGGAPSPQPAFPRLATQLPDIAALKLNSRELTATFVRQGEAWAVSDRGGYPADAGRIRQIVLTLAQLQLVEPKTDRPKLYSRLGVEDPTGGKSHLLTLRDKKGDDLAALIVGNERDDRLGIGSNGVYVRKPGQARSWLAAGSLDLAGKISTWLDRHILDIPQSRIASVALTEADGTKLTVKRAAAKDMFAVVDMPAGAKLKSENAAGQPASVLEALDLDDVEPAAKMPMPATGVTTASLTTFDGLTIDLKLFQHDKKDWIAVSASGTGKTAAEAKQIAAKVTGWSYEIPSYKANLLTLKLADLLAAPKS